MIDTYLFVEKYRPQTIDDAILPKELTKTFNAIVESGDIPNMIFSGSPGTGKTTCAKAICRMLGIKPLVINASEDGNIDTLRTTIRNFATTGSLLENGPKVVILDEADHLNPQSTQPAMRGFIEEFSDHCRFIFTCNHKNKILPALHSRLQMYEFTVPKKELPVLAGRFMNRLKTILDAENIKYEEKVLVELIKKYAPDWRKLLGEVQKYGSGGIIDAGILVNMSDESIKSMVSHLKNKDFKKMRKWVSDNIDTDASSIFRSIYDHMNESMEPHSIPNAVLILADYQYKNAFAADQELNVVACMTELMMEVNWK